MDFIHLLALGEELPTGMLSGFMVFPEAKRNVTQMYHQVVNLRPLMDEERFPASLVVIVAKVGSKSRVSDHEVDGIKSVLRFQVK